MTPLHSFYIRDTDEEDSVANMKSVIVASEDIKKSETEKRYEQYASWTPLVQSSILKPYSFKMSKQYSWQSLHAKRNNLGPTVIVYFFNVVRLPIFQLFRFQFS